MQFRNKALDTLTAPDLQALVTDQVAEQRQLEYKVELPSFNPPEKKREFLADVSSFANAAGGFLVYGIREENGLPVEVVGLPSVDLEKEHGRLIQAIHDGLDPRIFGVVSKRVPVGGGKEVLILGIPKSWNAPHAVWFERNSKFWSRNSDRKFQMSVQEIRAAMTGGEAAAEKVRKFRDARIGRILSGEHPVRIPYKALLTMHVLPIESFQSTSQVDLQSNSQKLQESLIPMRTAGGWTPEWGFDGFFIHSVLGSGGSLGYAQIFRNGAIEAVDGGFLANSFRKPSDQFYLPSGFVRPVATSLGNYLKLLSSLGLLGPVVVSLSLLNVRDYRLGFENPWGDDFKSIGDDNLMLPESYIEDRTLAPETHIRGAMDALWNACGLARCGLYGDDGRFKPNK